MSDPALNSSQLVPGYRLDRYELLCPVARGGMAAVWLARFQGKHGFEKLVALKTILPSFAGDSEFRRMFLDEATIASRIEHSNVAQILDLGEHEGTLYLVMEWVEGDSVSRLERAAQQAGSIVPQAIALRIASDACAGLHAAHELRDASGNPLGVVHRDVSPQNILVNSQGVVKVIDFGIAKARDRATEDTRTGIFKGKLHYMAPEQAIGGAIDRRADVWAVAAVLYRLLAQRPVYDGGNRSDTLRDLTSNAPVDPLPLHVSPHIAAIIAKALSFDPNARYATCAELKGELDRAIHSEALYTTTEELSAFLNLHLGSHLEARRQALKVALQNLTDDSAPTRPTSRPPPTRDLPESDSTIVLSGATADLSTEHQLRPSPAQVWQATPNEGSLTAGSTSLQVEPAATRVSAKRKRVLYTFAALGSGVLLLAWLKLGVGSSVSRVEPAAVAGSGSAQPRTVSAPPGAAALVRAAPPAAVASSEPSPAPAVSVVSLESLALTPAVSTTPAKPRTAAPKPASVKRKRKVVDDGF